LSPNKKVTKEVGIGEALKAALPRVPAALSYVPLPARTRQPLEHLNGQYLPSGCSLAYSGGSAPAALPKSLFSSLCHANISGKKSEHFLPEQELL